MDKPDKIVDFSSVAEMLFGEDEFIREFADAAIQSFTEFQTNFSLFLKDRDESNLRKAGHKIKPVAQMLNVQMLVDEYEHSKILLTDNRSNDELDASVIKMNSICNKVLAELHQIMAHGYKP